MFNIVYVLVSEFVVMKSIFNIRVMYILIENLCIYYNSIEKKKRVMFDLEDWNDFYDVVMFENRNI